MTLALIFLILLGALVIFFSWLVWKSQKIKENDKLIAIVIFMGLFCLVAVANQYYRGKYSEQIIDLDQVFFGLKGLEIKPEYDIPFMKGYSEELIGQPMSEIQLHNSSRQPFLLLLEGPTKTGKTFFFQTFLKEQQRKKIPAIYFDLKASLQTVEAMFESTAALKLIENEIASYNQQRVIPWIVLDSADKAVTQDKLIGSQLKCVICDTLKGLLERRNVSIVLITNTPLLQEKLISIPEFYRWLILKKLSPLTGSDLRSHLIKDVNPTIKLPGKMFSDESIEQFISKLGFDFYNLHLYLSGPESTLDGNTRIIFRLSNLFLLFLDFVDRYLNEFSQRLPLSSEYNGIFKSFLDHLLVQDNSKNNITASIEKISNEWISFGKLRSSYGSSDLKDKLEDCVSLGYLDYRNGCYRVKNPALFNALLIQFKYN